MSLDTNPTVGLRLSADQLKIIDVGLNDLVKEAAFVQTYGYLRRHPLRANEYERFDRWEPPTADHMAPVLSAHQKISPVGDHGRRLRLTTNEIAACIFATRHTERLIREKHVRPWKRDQKKAGKRIRKTLERFRKRAKRALIKQYGTESYKVAWGEWRQDLAAIRQQLVPTVNERKQPRCCRVAARELVDRGQQLAVAGLRMRGYEAPDGRLVRSLVRDRLRLAARRGTSRRQLLDDEISAAMLLADYIISRCEDDLRHMVVVDAGSEDFTSAVPQVQLAPEPPVVATTNSPRITKVSMPKAPKANEPRALRAAHAQLERLTWRDWNDKSPWSRLNRFERAVAVAEIANGGVSNREIARKLGVDEGTVRRQRKEAKLPKEAWVQINRGKSLNRVLREENDPALQQGKRLEQEKADGSVSDRHAEQVQSFVTKRYTGVFARQVVKRAQEMIAQVSAPRLARVLPSRDVDDAIRRLEPAGIAADGVEPLESLALWLVRWLATAVAPEPIIHLAALAKALKALPDYHAWGRVS